MIAGAFSRSYVVFRRLAGRRAARRIIVDAIDRRTRFAKEMDIANDNRRCTA
jgi:hypothetical protein